MTTKINTKITLIYLTVFIILFLLIMKKDALTMYKLYIFNDGPYMGRIFFNERENLNTNIVLKKNIINKEIYAQRFLVAVDLKKEYFGPLNYKFKKTEIENYQTLINEFLLILESNIKKNTDSLALEINYLVHKYHKKNKHKPSINLSQNFKIPMKSNPKDYLFLLSNSKTGCGETAAALEILLRNAGFKTRHIIYSDSKTKIQNNHNTIEFFSKELQKWVYLEPLVNFPAQDKINLKRSIFELTYDDELLKKINSLFGDEIFTSDGAFFFDINGIKSKNFFYNL